MDFMDSDIFKAVRAVCDLAYLVAAGPVFIGFLWYGIRQIKANMAQAESVKIQNERDALKSTIEQCRFLKDTIIPKYNDLTGIGKKKPSAIPCLQKTTVDILPNGVFHADAHGCAEGEINKEYELNQSQINEICNDCELFAMHFTQHVASDEIAFNPCARSFCDIVDSFAPYIYVRFEAVGMFSNLWELYTRWKMILKSKELAVENVKNKRFQQNLGVPNWTVKK